MITIRDISRVARERNLRHLLIGGHAVIAHGYHRMTEDVDFVVRSADKDAWTDLLLGLGYSLFNEGPGFVQFESKSKEETPVDLMVANESTFEKFWSEAVPHFSEADYPSVVSLRHLLATKSHAIKHGGRNRVGKDLEDMINLIMANRLNIDEDQWRELILTFGTKELYEKLQRTCKD